MKTLLYLYSCFLYMFFISFTCVTSVLLFRLLPTGVSKTSVLCYDESLLRCTNNSSVRGMWLSNCLPWWISILEALTQEPKSSWFSLILWFLNYVHLVYTLIMIILYCLWVIKGLLVFELNYEVAYIMKCGFIISVTETSTWHGSGQYLNVQSSKTIFHCGKLCMPWDRMGRLKSVSHCRITLYLALGTCIGALTCAYTAQWCRDVHRALAWHCNYKVVLKGISSDRQSKPTYLTVVGGWTQRS